jgi:hypothetical protein
MVPNIAKSGSSFRGAGRYYLHDKAAERDGERKPETHERVAFTSTRNCVNDDPHRAIDEMWATAAAQTELKRASGLSLGGRKCTDPVKTISLSWHPSETPTPEQMIAAADSYLTRMGWNEHQAVYVGHNDTAHPHIHIILNRVHPETGRVLDDRKDYRRAQEWALDYEKEHGRIFCEKRLDYERAPHERQHAHANDNIPHDVILLTRPQQQQFQQSEMSREALDRLERDLLKADQRAEREAWFADGATLFKDTRNAVWREVREEYLEDWKQFYAEKAAREEEAREASSSAVGRALYFARSGDWENARVAFSDRDAVMRVVREEFSERAQALRTEQRDEVRERQTLACDALRLDREDGYKELLARQAADRAEMRELHASGERAAHLVAQTLDVRSANQNLDPTARTPVPANSNGERDAAAARVGNGNDVRIIDGVPEPIGAAPKTAEPLVALEMPTVALEERDAAQIRDNALTGAADLGAGMMGGAASYLADQLAEAFAPTPPEVREAQAKAAEQAREAAEQAKPVNPYLRHIGDAEQKARDEREREERERYWDDALERRRER